MSTFEAIYTFILINLKQDPEVIFIPLFFIGLFIVLPYLMGNLGKWKQLAQMYALPGMVPRVERAQKQKTTYVKVGSLSYNGGVEVIATPGGLYLKPIFYMRWSHPTLFIPWNEITKTGEADNPPDSRTTTGLVYKGSKFKDVRIEARLQRTPNVDIVFDETAGDFIFNKKREFGF